MGSRTIEVDTWGTEGIGTITVRVRDDGLDTPAGAAARSIERRTGLVFCAGPRSEGTSLDNCGQPEARHYSGALGHSLGRGQGYSVEGQIWFSIPVGQ